MLVLLGIARSALSLAAFGAIAEVGCSTGSTADVWIPLGERAAGAVHHRCGGGWFRGYAGDEAGWLGAANTHRVKTSV
jgi:hypothetical protein